MNKEEIHLNINTHSLVKAIIIIALAVALFLIRDIILVILTAIVIASAIEPASLFAIKHRIPRTLAVLFVYVFAGILFLSALYFLLVPLLSESSTFLSSIPEYTRTLATTPNTNTFLSSITSTLSIPDLINQINSTLVHVSNGFFGTIDVVFGGILSFVLIIVLSFYLAVQEDGISKLLRIVTPIKSEKYVISLWKRSQEKIGLWMQGQLLLGVIVAVLVFLGLTILGVPNAILLAVIAGVLEIIPIFGPVLSAVPAVIIAFGAGGFGLAALVVGLFLIIQQFENHLIYPLVVKKVIGVPPIVSILALVIGAKLAGFLGLVLSVPIATVLMVLIEDLEKSRVETIS